MPAIGAFCFFKHVTNSDGKNIMETYRLITLKIIKEGLQSLNEFRIWKSPPQVFVPRFKLQSTAFTAM
jgi:hypothetical protein